MTAAPPRHGAFRVWADMIKLSHSIFALPFAVAAAFLAGRHLAAGHPGIGHIALIVACMVTARSVAMTFNRLIDVEIDARNPRTVIRPLVSGAISMRQAWVFLVLGAVGFLAACSAFMLFYANPWPLLLAVPVLAYLCAYSLCKRFTRWSHFVLGSAIGLSPAAAWLAIDPSSIGWPAGLLCVAVMLWIGGFDIIYACQDAEVDRREGLHSLPASCGEPVALCIARCAHVMAVLLLAGVGMTAGLTTLYWIGVGMVAILLIVEHCLVSADDLSRVNMAFFTVNGIVSIVLGVLTVIDAMLLGPLGGTLS